MRPACSLLLTFALSLLCLVMEPARAQQLLLFQNQSTAEFMGQAGADVARTAKTWSAALARLGKTAKTVDTAGLQALRQQVVEGKEARVLILPSAVVLSASERESIAALVNQGWSIFGTWAVGSRDEKFAWTGYSFIEDNFNTNVLADYDLAKTDGWFLLPVGETPLTTQLAAGLRIYMPKITERLLLVQPNEKAALAARGGDWVRQATMSANKAGLVTYSEAAGARRAFWGVPESIWDTSRAQFDQLLGSTLSWLLREPQVIKGNWPHPYQSALLIEMDTEDQFANAGNLLNMLESRGLTGTFYSLTSVAVKHAEVVKRIAARHELAFHAEVHDGFKDLPLAEQERRMRSMQTQLGTIVPAASKATGFRAPLESFDSNTEIAMRKLGLKHHAGSPGSSESTLPVFSNAEAAVPLQQRLVVLPRTMLDDINLLQMGVSDPSRKFNLLISQANDIHQLRGFGLLSVHSQYFGNDMPLTKAFPAFLDSVMQPTRQTWVTHATAIEQWWRAKEQVNLQVTASAGQLNLDLTNNAAPLAQFKVIVMLPKSATTLQVSSPAVKIDRLDDQRVALVWTSLPSGQTNLSIRLR
jgi:hypothetical protein